MPNVEIITLTSWQDFHGALTNHANGNWYFRGVSSINHALIPKIGRATPYELKNEQYVLRAFRRQARPYLSYHPTSDLEWMALAQHHGLATRLLDWSFSPLVAAYFAVESTISNDDACVYAIRSMQSIFEMATDPFKGVGVIFYRPPHITARISSQHAAFSVHFSPNKHYEPDGLVKLVIPSAQRALFRHYLNFMGINRATLFPSLDGLADQLNVDMAGWSWSEDAGKNSDIPKAAEPKA